VSAMKMASPAASGSAPPDPVRALQHTLYRTAKMDAGRRFHALGDKVIRSDVLMRSWFQVYRNQGASGVDRITVDQVKEYGVTRLLDELATTGRTVSSVAGASGVDPEAGNTRAASAIDPGSS
jgi:hypothetical protein